MAVDERKKVIVCEVTGMAALLENTLQEMMGWVVAAKMAGWFRTRIPARDLRLIPAFVWSSSQLPVTPSSGGVIPSLSLSLSLVLAVVGLFSCGVGD